MQFASVIITYTCNTFIATGWHYGSTRDSALQLQRYKGCLWALFTVYFLYHLHSSFDHSLQSKHLSGALGLHKTLDFDFWSNAFPISICQYFSDIINSLPTSICFIISCFMSRPQRGGVTYLSLWIKVCFVSNKDHGELIPVLHPKNLSLEFVDFFKAVKKMIMILFIFNA